MQISIGVSSCLLGHPVRYDGKHKRCIPLTEQLCQQFHCVPICPEVAIGLGTPRAPIGLYQGSDEQVRAISGKNQDFSDELKRFADQISRQYYYLDGYVFKSRSPSCGKYSVPLLDEGQQIITLISGLYCQRLCDLFAGIPMVEEVDLVTDQQVDQFTERVRRHAQMRL